MNASSSTVIARPRRPALPRSRTRLVLATVAVIAFALLPLGLKSYGTYLCSLFCVYLMATFGLNLTVGYAGQMSLGQAAFLGIGAYIAAIGMKAGLPFFAMLPLAALACFVIGLALGFPALRVQHHYLAFATLGFNVLVFLVLRNEEAITGGTFGIRGIPRPSLFGLSLDRDLRFFWFTLASTLILIALLGWLLRSPWGRAFAALRDNPIRAESLGVNITAYTLLAFAIGACSAGIAGAYFASLVGFIDPAPFNFTASLLMLLGVIAGGAGRFLGPVVGTVIIVLLPEWLRFMQNWYLAAFGVAVIALMVWLPGGLLSLPDRLTARRVVQ
jgi:branched-chain amino acid transport system permease protein